MRKKDTLVFWLLLGGGACATLPTPSHKSFEFPAGEAFIGHSVSRPYQILGWVKSKVNFLSLDPDREESDLCKNYYSKSVQGLVQMAKDKGGNAVMDVQSVVFLENGRQETYSTAECSDDGMEGQALTQGIAIQWK